MPNYANGKIYKIWSPSHPDIYIGSTVQILSARMTKHRAKYKMHKEGKGTYYTSFKILEYGDARIELIEDCKCERKEELTAREGYYIRTLNCVNKRIEDRTKKEYYQDNKQRHLQRCKEYYENNRGKIAQYNKEYHEKNKVRHNQKSKEYRENNKKNLIEKSKEKITCECGSICVRSGLARHKKTKKHVKYLESLM